MYVMCLARLCVSGGRFAVVAPRVTAAWGSVSQKLRLAVKEHLNCSRNLLFVLQQCRAWRRLASIGSPAEGSAVEGSYLSTCGIGARTVGDTVLCRFKR